MLYRDGELLSSELRLHNLAGSRLFTAQQGPEHGSGDVRLRQRRASRLLMPALCLRSMKAIAGGCMHACVMAIMWMAALRRRLPQRLSRCRVELPEQTGRGAVP